MRIIELLDNGRYCHRQSRWICKGRHLGLKLWRHSTARLLTEDLFSCDPAIFIDEFDPVFEDYETTDSESGGAREWFEK